MGRFGIQYTRKKDFKVDAMWETFLSVRRGENSYQISEGTPDDFYDREILYLTASVLQQNIETQLPHLILFHDDAMANRHKQQLDLLDQLTERFPYKEWQKKKKQKKFPR